MYRLTALSCKERKSTFPISFLEDYVILYGKALKTEACMKKCMEEVTVDEMLTFNIFNFITIW